MTAHNTHIINDISLLQMELPRNYKVKSSYMKYISYNNI